MITKKPPLLLQMALFASLCLVAAPRAAHALIQPLCGGITCSGSGLPQIQISSTVKAMSHPEIVPVFWGTYWNTGTSPSRGMRIANIQALVNGAYFGALSQYGGSTGDTVGPARMAPVAPLYTATDVPSPQCADGSSCTVGSSCGTNNGKCNIPKAPVRAMVEGLIANGTVPPPVADSDMLYVVLTPPGSSTADWNKSYSCSSSCGAYAGLSYNLAMVAADTGGLAHEIVEAIANNVSDANCTYGPGGSAANQISDLCSCYYEHQMVGSGNTITVQAYWSEADQKCVIPEGWNGVYAYDGYGWGPLYNGTVRQVYAGNYGVFATDTSDDLYAITSGTPVYIGAASAMFAVGDSSVVALSADASGVWEYTTSGGWNPIGGGASSVYAGGPHTVATDDSGNPYANVNGGWVQIGGPSVQFALDEGGLVGLSLDHGGIWRNANVVSPSGWTHIGGSADEIFVGVNHGIALTALASTKSVSYYSGSGTTWYAQGSPGNMFAVTSDGHLYGLTPSRGGIYTSTNTSVNNPPWTNVTPGVPIGRLVARSDSRGYLYATGAVTYN